MEKGGKKKTITDAVELFLAINAIAKRNGVGRIDIVSLQFRREIRDSQGVPILTQQSRGVG